MFGSVFQLASQNSLAPLSEFREKAYHVCPLQVAGCHDYVVGAQALEEDGWVDRSRLPKAIGSLMHRHVFTRHGLYPAKPFVLTWHFPSISARTFSNVAFESGMAAASEIVAAGFVPWNM